MGRRNRVWRICMSSSSPLNGMGRCLSNLLTVLAQAFQQGDKAHGTQFVVFPPIGGLSHAAAVLHGGGLAPGQPPDATLIPVVPHVDEKLAIILAEMKHSGFSVSVFLIRNKKHYPEAATLLARHQIHVFHIMEEASLHEISPQKIGH